MLELDIPIGDEYYDDEKGEFILETVKVQFEHSLVSLHKWESKWKKPFYTRKAKTPEETIDYIKCMTLTEDVDPEIYNHLTPELVTKINNYIDDSMTATTFSKDAGKGGGNGEVITAEIIYYWMMSSGISYECRYWHLNQLLTLVRVFSVKSSPSKKMPRSELMSRNRSINAARKAQLNTKG